MTWKHLFYVHEDDPLEYFMVARFDESGKLTEYNSGELWRFDSDFLAQVCKKVLKSMTVGGKQ